MSTTTVPSAQAAQPSRWSAGRVLLLVFGSLAVLIALGMLAGGIAAIWGLSQRDDSGYFTSGSHPLSTPSYAIVSDNLDVGTDAPRRVFDDHFATVRIEATSSQPVFIGIGHTSDVAKYLAGVRYDSVSDINIDPFRATYVHRPGAAQPEAPASQGFWSVKASGAGTQTISWPLDQGNWSAVAMNADASPGVTVATRFGAKVPYLRWIVIGFLTGGGLLLLAGATLIYFGGRRPRTATPA